MSDMTHVIDEGQPKNQNHVLHRSSTLDRSPGWLQ